MEQYITGWRPLMYITTGGKIKSYLVSQLPNGRLNIINEDGTPLRHPQTIAGIIRYFGGTRAVVNFCTLEKSVQLSILQSPTHVQRREQNRSLKLLRRREIRAQRIEVELQSKGDTPSEYPMQDGEV